ncbi:hypothetical protein HDV06_001828 [Boothiomyces sp. JEL0866]|nr:hypothetical protein HDV06_001828 [Boothiomyces sp. JEL0866]
MSTYSGIPLTTQSAQSQSFYLAKDYHIDDGDSVFIQQNATLNDCLTMCAQNDGVYFMCTAFSFHTNTCYFLDRPINTYNMAKNQTNTLGFILARNQNCQDNGGITCQNLPNLSSQSKPSSNSNYQNLDWTVSNGWYNSNCKGTTNPIQAYTGTISDSECKDDCNTYPTCTAYAYSNSDSTCALYDLNLNTIRFTKDSATCGFRLDRSQNCFDNGKSITCQGYQNSSSGGSDSSGQNASNSSNSSSGGSNTGMIIGIVVAVLVVVICIAGFVLYKKRKSKAELDHVKPIENIPPPTDAIPVEQVAQNQYFQVTLPPASRADSKSTAVASNAPSPQQDLQNSFPPAIHPKVESELPILQPTITVPLQNNNEYQPPLMPGTFNNTVHNPQAQVNYNIQPPLMPGAFNNLTQPPIIGATLQTGDTQPPVIVVQKQEPKQETQHLNFDAQPPIMK